jgi:hypothetical protein
MAHEVIPLFPTPLFVTEIQGFTDEELEFVKQSSLYARYKDEPGRCVGSDRFDIIHLPEMSRVCDFVQTQLNLYAREVMSISNQLFPTISWLNRTTTGAYHYQHHHVNSIVSGVLYFTEDPAPIEFHTDKNCVWGPLKMFPTKYNQYNTHSTTVEIKQGTLLIFPSYLEHSVMRSLADTDRISLSFNTWINGTIGLLDKTSFLNLDAPTLKFESKDNLNVLIERQRLQK